MTISRRRFVKSALTAGAGVAFAGLPTGRAAAAGLTPEQASDQPAVLYDLTRCMGCRLCEVACQMNKGLTPELAVLSLRPIEANGTNLVRRHQCMHCLDPGCVTACPVAAMQKTEAGPVIYKDERCLGCRYCMNACPFGVPTFDWDRGLLDAALIRKCDFCAPRQAQGKRPACVEACPTGAVSFGRRREKLAEAKRLIKENPNRYFDHVYGDREAGGTSFLIIAGVEPPKLGLPSPGYDALPRLPETIMGGVVPFALGWATVLSGVAGLVRWRERRTAERYGKEAK